MAKQTTVDIQAEQKLKLVTESIKKMPLTAENFRSALVQVGRSFLGVSEIGTTNTGYWVSKFNKDLGLGAAAWCLSYVQFVYKYTSNIFGLKDVLPYNTASTQSLWGWAYKNNLTFTDYTLLKPGDIFIWRNGITRLGHTGFLSESAGELVSTLEGNTNSAFSRDGGDVCEHKYSVLRWGPVGVSKKTSRYLRGFVSLDKLLLFGRII